MSGVVPSPGTTRQIFPARANPIWIWGDSGIRDWNEPEPVAEETTSLNVGVSGTGSPTTYNTPVFNACPPRSWSGRFASGGVITARYQANNPTTVAESGSVDVPPVEFNLLRLVTGIVAPGGVRFEFNGRTYVDRQGDLIYNPSVTTNAGNIGGTIDYSTGQVSLTDWASGDFSLGITGLGAINSESPTNRLFFRTPAAPIAQASMTIQANSYEDGSLIQATAGANGEFDNANVRGFVDVENGIAEIFFGQWVTAAGNEGEWWYNADAVVGTEIFKPLMIIPGSAVFSCVALASIPLDPGILGLDPIMLPSDGRVPIFNPGDSLMAVQRSVVEVTDPQAGEITDLGINNVKWVRVRDANGAEVLSEHYTIDGLNGNLQWANPLDLSAYTGPYTIEALSYFKRLCSDVQISGEISMAAGAPFGMDPLDGDIFLCSKLIFQPEGGTQDLQALYTNLFTQAGWDGEWSDSPTAGPTTGQYDDINFPIGMLNNGSITERWRVQFASSTTSVNVIGERFGQVLTNVPINEDIAPINPATGTPYFTLKAGGWGAGWDIGDVLRFNTLGANDPVWFIRSTQPGDAPEMPTDRFIAHLQGDVSQEENE